MVAVRRNVGLRVRLSPMVHDRLVAIADRRGLLPATLVAGVLGEWAEEQARQDSLRSQAAERAFAKLTDPGVLSDVLDRALVGLVASMQSAPLPDAELQPFDG